MPSDRGFRRLVAFSDAVVAIAITLLVLPLADAASSDGAVSLDRFYRENDTKMLAFALSFAVIGSFWWGQHQVFERVRTYNFALVVAMFVWLFGIVLLPFPTELLSAGQGHEVGRHAIYIGTMLLCAVAALAQQAAIVHWTDLQVEESRGEVSIAPSLILVVLMAVALVVSSTVPAIGLWALLVLVLTRPLEHLAAARRKGPGPPPSHPG